MNLLTKHFGEIEFDDDGILSFEAGLPGFEKARRFLLIDGTEEQSAFKWLQCIDEPMLAFAVVNPFLIKKDYDFEVNDEVVDSLGISNEEDVSVYSILVVPEDLSKISMNLKAPVIINNKNNKAAQIILDTGNYTVRHYIVDEIRRQEVAENAGIDKEKGSNNHNK